MDFTPDEVVALIHQVLDRATARSHPPEQNA